MLWKDPGHDDPIFISKQRTDLLQRGRLALVIGLVLDACSQIIELLAGVLPIGAEPRRQEKQEQIAKILADRAANSGILDLDGDLLPILEPGAMDLSEGCRRKGAVCTRADR